ncbi:MAG: rhodanese-like domain-containing protein, partial [Propionibacteriaceae bacterium]
DDVTFFDGRNRFEAEIGRFRGAVVPDVATTKDFVTELDSGRYDHLKDRPVVTYCTGGIRCEVLTSLMVNRGFSEVYQLDGGIVRYGEAYGDDGLWEGSLYVFDDRISVDFSDRVAVIGHCEVCAGSTNAYRDCTFPACKGRALLCADHAGQPRCEAHR